MTTFLADLTRDAYGELCAVFHDVPAGLYRLEADMELGLAAVVLVEERVES